MEKVDKIDTRLRWKKIHGGVHYHSDGQVVKKGEILRAYPGEMSEVVKNGFECLDTVVPDQVDMGKQLLVQMVAKGRYNVINPITDKAINSVPISKKAAESFGPLTDIKDKVKED